MHAKTVAIVASAGLVAAGGNCPLAADYQFQLPGNSVYAPDTTEGYTPTKGVPFEIIYDGRNLGPKLDFVLGKGPGTNVIPQGFILQDVANCGEDRCKVSWTPDCSVEDTAGVLGGYGIRMIDQATCKFQWTQQFGIKKGEVCGSTPKPSPSPQPSASKDGPKPSGKPEPSGKDPKPHPSYTVSCDDDSEPTGKPHPKPSGHYDGGKPDYPKPSGYPSGPKGETDGYYPPKNGTTYQHPNAAGGTTKPSYTPLQSNDAAGQYAINAFGALVALATSFMLL